MPALERDRALHFVITALTESAPRILVEIEELTSMTGSV
jgi:hypothetical protein